MGHMEQGQDVKTLREDPTRSPEEHLCVVGVTLDRRDQVCGRRGVFWSTGGIFKVSEKGGIRMVVRLTGLE